ncbi:MAG TPA: hypothetical protein PK981_09760, partial [Accumulibacter sp.]|nr:hypothetical protein [Accumulibacter sp.]
EKLASAPPVARPRLLAFESDRFIDDLLAAVRRARPLPKLLPWRDWSEPPAAMFDVHRRALYPTSIERRQPEDDELVSESGPQIADDGVPMSPPDGAAKTAPPWLRKLYLPLHERFNVVAFDVVCHSAGWPRLARGRVRGAGAVIRRLRADASGERWDDWLAVDEKHGAWLPLLDGEMRPAPGAPPVDPQALPAALLADQASLRAVFDAPVGTPLPPLALTSQPLALLPPDAGDAAEHCTLYGYLPVFSGAQEIPRERLALRPVAEIAAALRQRSEQQLGALFQDAGRFRAAAAGPLRRLLENTVLPPYPSASERASAQAVLIWPATPGNPEPIGLDDSLATSIDRILQQAIWRLWTRAAAPSATDHDLDGQVISAADLWNNSGAAGAASQGNLFAGTGDARTIAWLENSVAGDTTPWDTLARQRLHQLLDAWLAGTALPAPVQGSSTVIGDSQLQVFCATALLRLRGCRLALAASLNRFFFNADHRAELTVTTAGVPASTVASLAEQVQALLAQEDERADQRTTPPWPPLSFPGLGDAPRVLAAHRAGVDLAEVYAPFAAELAAAGSAAAAQLVKRAADVENTLRAALQPQGSLAAFAPLGIPLAEEPARALLVLPGFRPATADLSAFASATAARYTAAPQALALPEARARETVPRLRFDADHLYAVWCWVRVAGHHPCEPERVVWTPRSEPFLLADPTDLLGARPATIQMPDIGKLLRDLPRVAKSRARPFAAMAAPPGSAISTGAGMADTRRDFGLGSVCSFGIPVLTLCALILFNIIFHILIVLPGFGWMMLLKFCIPFRRRDG